MESSPPEEPRPIDEPWAVEESERLEVGPAPTPSPRARIAVAVAALAGAVVLAGVVGLSGRAGLSAPEPETASVAPTPIQTPSPIDWPTPRERTPPPPRPMVFSSSGFLADVDIDLFVRSNRAVFRIDTLARQVVRTAVSGLESSGPSWFVPIGDRVILRPMDRVPGYMIIDGQGARPLTGLLADDGQYLPGPDGRIWVIDSGPGDSTARLTDAEGRRVYEQIKVPSSGGFRPDGAGGLFFASAANGTYQLTHDGLRRVTRGSVVATSRDRFMTVECDARYVCTQFLHDRRTGSRQRLGPVPPVEHSDGLIAPDGQHVAMIRSPQQGPALDVIELRTSRVIATWQMNSGDWMGQPPMVWLPDGRLLGLESTRLFVFDPRTGEMTRSPIRLPPLRELVVRLPAG